MQCEGMSVNGKGQNLLMLRSLTGTAYSAWVHGHGCVWVREWGKVEISYSFGSSKESRHRREAHARGDAPLIPYNLPRAAAWCVFAHALAPLIALAPYAF